jgi:MFS superfamily sulfate permease-like transporter
MEQLRQSLGRDALSSVVVFLVALPLCLGIAIASGVPPALGLISGIIGGLVIGAIAGSPLQVSGPAAGLAVIVAQIVHDHGIAVLGIVVLIAGAVQLVAGALRLGSWFRAVSPAVIQGMLAGIGVLIFASQFHVMVDDKPQRGGLMNLLHIPSAIYKGVFPLDGSVHHQAALIGLITIAVIVIWNGLRPERLKAIPGPLLAVVTATVVAAAWALPIQTVQVPASLGSAVTLPTLSVLGKLSDYSLWVAGFGMALVASAESLLCASAVDRMHTGPRTNYDREMMAQGVGNMLAGVLGALPITGVIVRSSANVESGAKTRLSALLHGAWLLLFVVAAPQVLALVPTAALAGILVYTGYKLINFKGAVELAKAGRAELVIYLATVIAIVTTDLLKGVLIGLALALVRLAWSRSHVKVAVDTDLVDSSATVTLEGAATFVSLPRLADALEGIPAGLDVHLRLGRADHIDHAAMEFIRGWEAQYAAGGGEVDVDWNSPVPVERSLAAARAAQAMAEVVAAEAESARDADAGDLSRVEPEHKPAGVSAIFRGARSVRWQSGE